MLATVYAWHILALIFPTECNMCILLTSDGSGNWLTGSIWSDARTLEGLTKTKKNKKSDNGEQLTMVKGVAITSFSLMVSFIQTYRGWTCSVFFFIMTDNGHGMKGL